MKSYIGIVSRPAEQRNLSGRLPALLIIALLLAGGTTPNNALAQTRPSVLTATPSGGKASKPIRLEFVNADISDILQGISLKTHASIVYSPLLKRPVSLNIVAANVNEAIGLAASAAGLACRQLNGKYFVASPADLKQLIECFGTTEMLELNGMQSADGIALIAGAAPYLTVRPAGPQLLVTGSGEDIALARTLLAGQVRPAVMQSLSEVIALKWLVAAEAANLVQALYPNVKAEPVSSGQKTGGAVGLVGPEKDVALARDTITKLDSEVTAGVAAKPVYKVYTVRYSGAGALRAFLEKAMPGVSVIVGPEHAAPTAADFHPLSTSLSGGGSGSSSSGVASSGSQSSAPASTSTGGDAGGKVSPDTDKAALLMLSGASEDVDLAMKLLAEVDIAPKQIMVEVQVVDMSPEVSQSSGINWNWSPLGAVEAPIGTALTNGAISSPVSVSGSIGAISRTPLSIQGILNALVTKNDAKILANPRIQVLDMDDANIFIGDTLRTQVSQSSISGTTVQVMEFPVGIILLVRPRVNPDGWITLRVHPVVSTVTSLGADNLPQTSTREAETIVRVRDGETVVIGGLIRDEMSKVVQEIPVLAKLPLVGQLFRSTTTDHRKSDVMVMITPHIIK